MGCQGSREDIDDESRNSLPRFAWNTKKKNKINTACETFIKTLILLSHFSVELTGQLIDYLFIKCGLLLNFCNSYNGKLDVPYDPQFQVHTLILGDYLKMFSSSLGCLSL